MVMDRSRLWIDRMEGYGGPTDRTGMDLRYGSDINKNRFCEKIKFILCQNKVK